MAGYCGPRILIARIELGLVDWIQAAWSDFKSGLLLMGKSNLSWLAITLIIAGAAITAGHPALGTITGLAILLLGVGTAVGALPVRGQPEDSIVERRVAGQKISNTLVTLSSAAILAVYTAGYYRTRSAADEFEAQAVRRKTAAPIAATSPGAEATPTVPGSPAPPLRKTRPRPSPTVVPKAAPAPIDGAAEET